MKRARASALPLLLLACAGHGSGSETVLLSESPAYLCYLAALRGGDAADVEVCTRAIERQPLATADLAATYSNRGLLRARHGDLDAALEDHAKAIHLAPELDGLYVNRANTLIRANRLRDALADLDRAIALEGDAQATAYYNRALLFQRLGDSEAARLDLERAE